MTLSTNSPDDRSIPRRVLMTGLTWAAPTAAVSLAAPAVAASTCATPSSSYGTAPLVRTPGSGTNPQGEAFNTATPTDTRVFTDNRATRGGPSIQYTRTIPISLTAGCCYRFSSSMSISTAFPHSGFNGGIVGLIFFEGSSRFAIGSRGQTYSDWPGITQVTVDPNPAVPSERSFSFEFCATQTRVHNYFQFVRVPPSGATTSPAGNGLNDDLRFHPLVVTPV